MSKSKDQPETERFVLCALEKDCMAPPGAQLKCNFARDTDNVYANCHRYDQSVINLLLANAYDYNASRFLSRIGDGCAIIREPSPYLSEENFTCALGHH
ncbi:hypothetical protein OESDEN_12993 [Oesophagostomum dentatum]|uniref:Uncharacterized protein n=1 Tax=Oesophagostomum dentatum TaxID=61180 RepID=A0A0B1SPJ8_OESDE|nr:hypothetical protein OESDEN_12993 [Oesophagostomum dentatum]